MLARGASDDLWRKGSIAPDLFAKSMSIWLIRGPLFFALASRILPHQAATFWGCTYRVPTFRPQTLPGFLLW